MASSGSFLPARPPTSPELRLPVPGVSWRVGDTIFRLLCQLSALFIIVIALLLVAVLTRQAWLAIRSIGVSFFTTETWNPQEDHRQFGALTFIYGTLVTSFIAMVLAVPLGIGTAAFLSEIAPRRLRRVGSFFVEMLAAIPSVVYGFWGLFVLAPLLQKVMTFFGGPNQGGVGLFSAGVILAIMIVPYVSAITFEVCQAVPRSQREASYALGATRWQTIRSVVLVYARPGIIGGCFLALGRALGETMAVTMMIGNFNKIDLSIFAMGNSIPSVIANEFTEATYDLYLSALVELGLILLLVNVIVNSFARFLIWRLKKRGGSSSPLQFLRFWQRQASLGAENKGINSNSESIAFSGTRPADRFAGGSNSEPQNRDSLTSHNSQADSLEHAPRLSGQGGPVAWDIWSDRLMTAVLSLCLGVTAGLLILIFSYLFYRGIGALDWNFFTRLPVPVGETGGGMANALLGSFMLVGLASLFSVPVGILAAIYLAEYRSDRLGPLVRFIGELLGGVPSIVIGIFGYYLVVKPLGHFSGWAGAFALGIMMLPIVMRATEEALRVVPQSLRHASYALGARQWQTVLRVVLPASLPAVVTAIFLAIARVVGETAPLMLTALNNRKWPTSPNDATPSLPFYIFDYAMSSSPDWHRQAWAAALVLLTVVMVLNFGIRLVTGRKVSVRGAE